MALKRFVLNIHSSPSLAGCSREYSTEWELMYRGEWWNEGLSADHMGREPIWGHSFVLDEVFMDLNFEYLAGDHYICQKVLWEAHAKDESIDKEFLGLDLGVLEAEIICNCFSVAHVFMDYFLSGAEVLDLSEPEVDEIRDILVDLGDPLQHNRHEEMMEEYIKPLSKCFSLSNTIALENWDLHVGGVEEAARTLFETLSDSEDRTEEEKDEFVSMMAKRLNVPNIQLWILKSYGEETTMEESIPTLNEIRRRMRDNLSSFTKRLDENREKIDSELEKVLAVCDYQKDMLENCFDKRKSEFLGVYSKFSEFVDFFNNHFEQWAAYRAWWQKGREIGELP